jgi:hypothetical protein
LSEAVVDQTLQHLLESLDRGLERLESLLDRPLFRFHAAKVAESVRAAKRG